MIYHKDESDESNLKMTEDATAPVRLCAGGSASVDRNSPDVKEPSRHEQAQSRCGDLQRGGENP